MTHRYKDGRGTVMEKYKIDMNDPDVTQSRGAAPRRPVDV
jgi:hypothetical protein